MHGCHACITAYLSYTAWLLYVVLMVLLVVFSVTITLTLSYVQEVREWIAYRVIILA